MTASAVDAAGPRVAQFWKTTNGKKAVMAVTGVGLVLFVVGHLAGNLQIFLGPEQFNGYARALRALPEILWPVRALLLIAVILHIWSSVQLAVVKGEARPEGYRKRRYEEASYASRTMYMSGPILAAFVIYHLMQFTWGVGGTRFRAGDPYGNVIAGFRVPAISVFYIIAMAMLCLHLGHGLWSMFQTLGLNHPRYTPKVKIAAAVLALLIFAGFISIPLAVMARLIPQII